MTEQHPYCRTCGSRTQSKNVCNHCGCEPMMGNSYCCDCGASTMPQAIMCVECGASFRRKLPAALAIFLACVLIATIGGSGYLIIHSNSEPLVKTSENISTGKIIDPPAVNKNTSAKNKEVTKIISNNIPAKLLRKKNDAILKLARNILPDELIREKPAPEPKAVTPEKIKKEPAALPAEKELIPSGRVSTNAFSSRELSSYSIGCAYYEGRSKNNIVFFTTNVYGYAKINGKMYALQGVQKTSDIARFSGSGYEVIIEIEGLAGTENDWVAAGTMTIKDMRQRTLLKHKIYSSCTDF